MKHTSHLPAQDTRSAFPAENRLFDPTHFEPNRGTERSALSIGAGSDQPSKP
jgi:hypothetical protein